MKKVVLVRSNPIKPDPPVEKIANVLIGLGHKVTILAWDRDHNYISKREKMLFNNGECDIVRFGIKASYGGGLKKNLKSLMVFQKRIFTWLKQNRKNYDIIHAFDFDAGLISSKISKLYHKKMVYHILDYYIDSHNLNNQILRNTIKLSENRVIARADATIICTEKRRHQITGSNPKRLIVIHNTPDTNATMYKDHLLMSNKKEALRIVYVGILANSRMLMEICDIVSNDSSLELHIGGYGPLQSKIADYSKSFENIQYYGRLSYDKTLKLESECDVMVAIYDPSVKNNQYAAPNKFYEALMLGKPIIMAKGTGFDGIINEEKIGELVSFDYDGIRKGIEIIGKRRNEWENIKIRENDLYKKYYSWSIMTDRIKQLYLTFEKPGETL